MLDNIYLYVNNMLNPLVKSIKEKPKDLVETQSFSHMLFLMLGFLFILL